MPVKNIFYNDFSDTPEFLNDLSQQYDRLLELHNTLQQLIEKHRQQQVDVAFLKKQVQTQINVLATLRQNRLNRIRKNEKKNVQKVETLDQSTNFIETLTSLIGKILPRPLYEQKIAKIKEDSPLCSHSLDTPKLKVAAILDEFSFMSLSPDLDLIQLKPDIYKQQIQKFKPDIIFIESAWFGHEKLWKRRESIVGKTVNALLNHCDSLELITIFWNKEDPIDFDHFLPLAKRCDIVLTTDEKCIERYKRALSHERVFALPFAVQPRLHNPTKEFLRQDRCCFAGAYYGRFLKRQRDLDNHITVINKLLPIDIYDRNFYSKNVYTPPFPEQYKQYIKGTLKFKAVNKAYKGYKFAININTVKHSPTMFSRRVFELAASNTVILSNYSLGIRQLFGNTIFSSDHDWLLENYVKKIMRSELIRKKVNLLALRQVMKNHTYQDRILTLKNLITNKSLKPYYPEIYVIAVINSYQDLAKISNAFIHQTFSDKQLLLITTNQGSQFRQNNQLFFRDIEHCKEFLTQKNPDSFVAFFSPQDHYGANYLQDLILATRYTHNKIVAYGKYSYFGNSSKKCRLYKNGEHYQQVKKLDIRCSIIRLSHLLENELFFWIYQIETTSIKHNLLYSTDEFNYCRNINKIKKFDAKFVDDLNPSELYHV